MNTDLEWKKHKEIRVLEIQVFLLTYLGSLPDTLP